MKAEELAQPHLLKQPVYVTGKPIAYTAREFGLDPTKIDKLALMKILMDQVLREWL